MKITKLMRLLFIAVAVVMVFSLFACTETPEAEETTTEKIENNEESSGNVQNPDEPENTESSDVAGGDATEPKETDPKETETETEPTPVCQHTDVETLAGKAATCTEDGITEGKKCTACGTVIVAQETIPAGHTVVVDAAVAPTCEATGLTEGKHCSACDTVLVAQETVAATGHKQVEKSYTAPTQSLDGWAAHTVCENCGKVWDAEGNAIDAVPTIAKLAPAVNIYRGYDNMLSWKIGGTNDSKWKPTNPSADRTYVRFERDGASNDGNVEYLVGNTAVTGQYLVIKYKTDHMTNVQLWANTLANGHDNGKANFYNNGFIADGEWHILILDLSKELTAYVKAAEDGTYTIQWARIDILDGAKDAGYFDIGFIALTDDLTKIQSVLLDGDTAYCTHAVAAEPIYENLGENHSTNCVICGKAMIESHGAKEAPVWTPSAKSYTCTCACGAVIEQNVIYVSEAATTAGGCNSFSVSVENGIVKYTNTGSADPFIHIYDNGTKVTGQYAVIKYRVSAGGLTFNGSYTGSVMGDHNHATGPCDSNKSASRNGTFVYDKDGAWQYVVVESVSDCFKPNEDGSYSYRFLRLGMAGFSVGDYIEVDEIAFVDNLYAAERYIKGDDAVCAHAECKYTWDDEAKVYTGDCAVCGEAVTRNYVYKTEANLGAYSDKLGYNVAGSCSNFIKATQEDGYVKYTAVAKADNDDTYFFPYVNGTLVTGQYMIIKYKIDNAGKNLTTGAIFASSVASGQTSAKGANGDSSNAANGKGAAELIGDGEWHYLVITPTEDNKTFTPNADGTYSWSYARVRFNGFNAYDGTCSISIDEIVFVDCQAAADAYIAQ